MIFFDSIEHQSLCLSKPKTEVRVILRPLVRSVASVRLADGKKIHSLPAEQSNAEIVYGIVSFRMLENPTQGRRFLDCHKRAHIRGPSCGAILRRYKSRVLANLTEKRSTEWQT